MQVHSRGSLPDTQPTIRLADLLGSGSAGTVFRAQRILGETIELVAVKVPHSGKPLTSEVDALTRFRHPNIVRLIDEDESSIVLELCDSGTVGELLALRPLSPAEVHLVVTSIGGALSTMHEDGWIHGDVNPANIGLRSMNPPCLLDLGTCRTIDTAPANEGTDGYTSEALPSSATLDVRALAITALAALGSPSHSPFPGPAATDLADSVSAIVMRCDRGEAVPIEVLYAAFDGIAIENPRVDHRHRRGLQRPGSPGGPTRTRKFGPRPDGNPTPQAPAPSTRPQLAKVAVVAVLFLLSSLIGFEIRGSTASAQTPAPIAMTEPSEHSEYLPAHETLEAAGAVWSADGDHMRLNFEETGRTFIAGIPGDRAAIADWNCDGTPTLGVFRPSTGAWFTFASWDGDSISEFETITTGSKGSSGNELIVEIDASGCARIVT